MIFVTSDHHFGHANIIKYCDRPFESLLEMDLAMIGRWNEVVGVDDDVWHLGDFCLGGTKWAKYYFSRLNGNVDLVPGNHDHRWLDGPRLYTMSGPVHVLPPLFETEIDGQHIVLCHYPLASWNRMHHGSVHFHGHTHSHPRAVYPGRVNLCVEYWDYEPLPLCEAIELALDSR